MYQIRKRENTFPVSHGADYESNQPVMVAHIGMMILFSLAVAKADLSGRLE